MRILIDYDGTISVRGKICKKKIELIRKAMKLGHNVKLYTARDGDVLKRALQRLHKECGLKIGAIGGREKYDFFLDLSAGDWTKLEELINGKKP